MESATLRSTPPLSNPTRVGLAGALLVVAVAAWFFTAERMEGMDTGPGTDLGSAGRFGVSWVLMMAAMMLPSLVPAAVAFARAGRRPVPAFVVGYLGAWTAFGLVAYSALEGVRAFDPGVLAWDREGRDVAAGVILAASAYQLTAGKELPGSVSHPTGERARRAAGSRRCPAQRPASRRLGASAAASG